MAEFVIKTIKNGKSDLEYLGDGQISRVRQVLIRTRLKNNMIIEVYSRPTRFSTTYRGQLYFDTDGTPLWESSSRYIKGRGYVNARYLIKPNGDLGRRV